MTLLLKISSRVLWAVSLFSATDAHAIGDTNNSFTVTSINQTHFVANLYLPKESQKSPIVIVLGGSSGGMRTARGEWLAAQGFAALTLVYFRHAELPQTLDRIPVESVLNSIDYLGKIDEIDHTKIGIWGASRGSELAFLAASRDARIKSVVVTSPSQVAWHGSRTPTAWTYAGKDITALSFERQTSSPIFTRARAALTDIQAVKQAQFKFELINGPLLIISAEQDQIWPSKQMAEAIVAYLQEKPFNFPVIHESYSSGHAFDATVMPSIHQSIIDHFKKSFNDQSADPPLIGE